MKKFLIFLLLACGALAQTIPPAAGIYSLTPGGSGGGGGGGTVTSVSSANAAIVVSSPTTTPVLTLAAINLAASGSGGVTGDLPFANLTPASAASILLGRGSASGAGDYQEITLGTGLTMTGTVLSAGGGSGNVTAAGTLTNNALVIGQGTTAVATTTTGTGVLTALGVNIGSAGAPVLFNGAGGTPSSLALTNATGYAVLGSPTVFGVVKVDGTTITASSGVISAVGGGGTGADPTASVGLSAVNGVAATFLRSDGAPPLSQAIVPTWTGVHTFTPAARTSGVASYLTINTPADTGITAATESIGVNFPTATRTWATTGTVALEREVLFAGKTYASAGASQTFTDIATVAITPPIAGTNAIFTRGHSLLIVDSTSATTSTAGALVVTTTPGTTATSVGIGAGNITFGTSLFLQGGTISFSNSSVAISPSGGGVTISPSGSLTLGPTSGVTVTKPLTLSPSARTSGTSPYLTINIPADTGQSSSNESIGVQGVTATRTWATTGTVTLQREIFLPGPTYASASPSQTFNDAFNLYLTPPIAGTNAIFTRGHTLGIVDSTSASSSITGGVVVSALLGTTATSVGIGGGNVNAGGTVTGANLTSSTLLTTSGTELTPAAAMGALAIDIGKEMNTKSISGDSTFTFSGTPATRQWFGMEVTNSDTNSHVLTIPSSVSVVNSATITSLTINASSKLYLIWNYDGSVYNVYGDPSLLGSKISASVATGSAVSLTTATPANVTNITLTPGTWSVSGTIYYKPASASTSRQDASINGTSATLSTTEGAYVTTIFSSTVASISFSNVLQEQIIAVTTNTTEYLVAQATFSAGTMGAFGEIHATRIK